MQNLAYRTGNKVADVRETGRRFFDELANHEPDLARILVRASTAGDLASGSEAREDNDA
ncbi:hypothetical protein [Tsuneonella sp. SYSU-LHT278]|uniref:hypothetical protein n=1 Tax=Tsuneonella sediminis TaxID=3416089 RepID=UPI003F79D446